MGIKILAAGFSQWVKLAAPLRGLIRLSIEYTTLRHAETYQLSIDE